MIISSPIASDSAVDRPSRIPPRTLFGSAIDGDAEREQCELPAVMVDPLRREHPVVRLREEQGEEGWQVGCRAQRAGGP